MNAIISKTNEGKPLNVLGDQQLVKLTGADTNGTLAVIIQNLAPGLEVPYHQHTNEDEHFHLIEGTLQITVADKTHVLNTCDMIFLPRQIPHAIKVVGNKPAVVHLSIVPAGIENMFSELDKLPAGPPDLNRVAEICGQYGVTFI